MELQTLRRQELAKVHKAVEPGGFVARLKDHFSRVVGQAVEIKCIPQEKPSITGGLSNTLERDTYEIEYGYYAPRFRWLPLGKHWHPVAQLTIRDSHHYEQTSHNGRKITKGKELKLSLTNASGQEIASRQEPYEDRWPHDQIFRILKEAVDRDMPRPQWQI